MKSPTSTRMSAEERRDMIVSIATKEFSVLGYAGTSAETIARRAGVSQPYLFQLFGTKKDLFTAAVRECFDRTRRFFETEGKAARTDRNDPAYILSVMGKAYEQQMLKDREMLLMQLHAYAACADPEIRQIVRREYASLYATIADVSGAPAHDLAQWFAYGMLLTVAAAMDLHGSEGSFNHDELGGALSECR